MAYKLNPFTGQFDLVKPVAGSNTEVQFNDEGQFGADTGLTYTKSTDKLTVGGSVQVEGSGQSYFSEGLIINNDSGSASTDDFLVNTDTITSAFQVDASEEEINMRIPVKMGDLTGGNYTEIESDGSLHSNGDATTWTDFSVPLTRDKQGQSSKPDYDFTNLGLLFPQNNTSEIVYLVMQMPHEKKMDSDVKLHMHYIQSESTKPTYKVDYKFYNNGSTVPTSWTTISTADGNKGILTYTSGDMLQIATFPAISLTDETVSANLDIKLYRDDNDLSGDSLAKYFDFHFEQDTLGSRGEYSK